MSDYSKLAQQVIDAYNRKELYSFLNLYAEEAEIEFPDERKLTRDDLVEDFCDFIEAVPDRRLTVTSISETDKGAKVDCIAKGRNTGRLAGNPPTNREISVPSTFIYDFMDGKIVHQKTIINNELLMQQIKGK